MAVLDEEAKKNWRRKFRRRQRGAQEISQQADDHIERLLIRRFERLISVRRFVLLWISLFTLLIFVSVLQLRGLSAYYQRLAPVAGGVFAEGLVGSFTNANPLYATGSADLAVSRLVFSGLFKYDDNNNLVGDLAASYSLNPKQTVYTVNLRTDAKWHDGQPFTADDVVFTYQAIQDFTTQSPLYNSWRDIKVSASGRYLVSFELPNPLSSFLYSLTNGIVPIHLLKNTPSEQLRTAAYNTHPVGTGPFEWKFLEVSGTTADDKQQRISLAQNDHYHGDRAKLDGFSLIVFGSEARLISAFQEKQINAISGLEAVPPELEADKTLEVYYTPLTSIVMAFFNNSRGDLKDVSVRKAMALAVDQRLIEYLVPYPVKLASGPLLPGQLGYRAATAEAKYDPAAAGQLLDQAGWKLDANGQRTKDNRKLQFSLAAQNTDQYTRVAQFLQNQWAKIGVEVAVRYYEVDDLQGQVIAGHDYDVLLYGISVGVDPDEFAYWDSSQARLGSQGHLNLSEYKSTAADQALQGARTRSDPTIRAVKYKVFLKNWAHDAPALALYQPNFLYISRGPVFSYGRQAYNSGADRYYNVTDWAIRQKHQTL